MESELVNSLQFPSLPIPNYFPCVPVDSPGDAQHTDCQKCIPSRIVPKPVKEDEQLLAKVKMKCKLMAYIMPIPIFYLTFRTHQQKICPSSLRLSMWQSSKRVRSKPLDEIHM